MLAPVASLAASSVPLDLARAAQGSVAAGKPSPAEVQKAARQFEAILVRQLLSPAIEPLMNGGSLGGANKGSGGQGGGVYSYFLTDTLADSIASGGGLGLAQVLSRQLAPSSSGLAETFADDTDPS